MQTDELINRLTSNLAPVERLRAPELRALAWVLALGLVAAAMIATTANLNVFLERMSVMRVAVETSATALTGVAAVFAAFELAIPGRSRLWAWLPVPPLLVWLGTSAAGCAVNGLRLHGAVGLIGESGHCFRFILLLSVPLVASLFWMLRRARPMAYPPVALMAVLGASTIAAFLLQFYHPFDVSWVDLGLHLSAIAVVLFAGSLAGRRIL